MNKLISVIMPVKNGERYLQEALDGIKKQEMNVEIILVNDASTDQTVEIAEKVGCLVINHEFCRGQVVAKNTGLKAAKGEYIMFHDCDDVMREGALARLYAALEEDESLHAVMAMLQDFISPDLTRKEAEKCAIRSEPYYGLFSGAVLIRREVFDIVGSFSESIYTGDIISWKFRLDKYNLLMKKFPFVATNRRVHSSNFGRTDRKKEFEDYTAVLRANLRAKMNGSQNSSTL